MSKDKDRGTDKKQKKKKHDINKTEWNITLFHREEDSPDFIPWQKGSKGTQALIKLKRGDETAFLYEGEQKALEAELQKTIFKLTNDGWNIEGDVKLEFNGVQKDEMDELFQRDLICLEMGMQLLPLVDPASGSPLLDMIQVLRRELAKSTGFVIPGIRVRDNLALEQNHYVIYIKETPLASGEIFLDRFLVAAPLEALSNIQGWSTKDPVYGSPAKWVEPEEMQKIEDDKFIIMKPIEVLLTHLRESIANSLKELLGLQEVKFIMEKLMETHPVVVEDFIKDKKKIRQVRKVLQSLAAERISIRDFVTILETIGDYEDKLDKTDFLTEMVRIALARQICWSYIDNEGKIAALVLSRKFEEKLQNSVSETKYGLKLPLNTEEVDLIIKNIRKTLEDYKYPRVVFCDPPSRLYFKRLTQLDFPNLGVLSTAEIVKGIKIEILGDIDLPADVKPTRKPPESGFEEDETNEENDDTANAEETAEPVKKKDHGGIFRFLK